MIIPATAAWSSNSVQLFLLDERDVTARYVEWLNDPAVNRYLESRFELHTHDSTCGYVRRCRDREYTLLLGIRDRNADHVGNIKLEINARHGLGEVGILIGKASIHGQGVGSEAIRVLSRIACEELGLRKLSAGCYGDNKGSERAFVKAGFTVEGRRPDHLLLDDQTQTLTLLGLVL